MELCAIDLAEALQHTSQRLGEALIKALLLQLLQGIATFHEAGPSPNPPGIKLYLACSPAYACMHHIDETCYSGD